MLKPEKAQFLKVSLKVFHYCSMYLGALIHCMVSGICSFWRTACHKSVRIKDTVPKILSLELQGLNPPPLCQGTHQFLSVLGRKVSQPALNFLSGREKEEGRSANRLAMEEALCTPGIQVGSLSPFSPLHMQRKLSI